MASGSYAAHRNSSVGAEIEAKSGPNNHSLPAVLWNESLAEDYIFDRTDVRVVFVTLYSVVFACCFFGKRTGIPCSGCE